MESKKIYKRPWLYIASAAVLTVVVILTVMFSWPQISNSSDLEAQLEALDREMLYSAVLPPMAEPWYRGELDSGTVTVINDKFPNEKFHCDGALAWVTTDTDGTGRELFRGMPLNEVYFCDLNFDGYPELCAAEGNESRKIIICDYKNEEIYSISDTENTNYKLHFARGRLYILSADRGSENYSAVAFLHNFRLPKYDLPTELFSLDGNPLANAKVLQVYNLINGDTKVSDKRFPGVVFEFNSSSVTAVNENGAEMMLYSGMPISDAYFFDVNGDGYPEICSNMSIGSGIILDVICVCDCKNGVVYISESRNGTKLFVLDDALVLQTLDASGNAEPAVTALTETILQDEGLFEKTQLSSKPTVYETVEETFFD